ncbi:MAG: ATP-dependent helicase, partial [Gemmatimonadota bacterium]
MSRLDLNPEQRAAVEHGEGPLLVLAGAGSGKTRVLTARIARLVEEEGLSPSRLLAVTFTNKAAGEMRERIGELLGREPAGLWASTFHSMAARLLRLEIAHVPRERNFSIYDQDDSRRTVKRAMEEAGVDPDRWSPRSVGSRISEAKSGLVTPEELARRSGFDLLARRVAEVYPVYQGLLRRANALDFDDLLVHAVRLLEDEAPVRRRYAERFLHVLVDEYQDTNHAQYRMVRALADGHGNLCVVGDDDQSIYGWRGADVSNILDFERDFPGARVIRLERNYRSTSSILEVANHVIAHNTARKAKELRTGREEGEPVRVVRLRDERGEARWTVDEIRRLRPEHDPGDVAVLYRTNAQSRPYEEALREAGVPYRVVGGVRFYERREVRDVLAYLRLVVNPADDAAFTRIVNWPRRGIGGVTLERLEEARADGEPLLEAAGRATGVEAIPTAGARSLEAFADQVAELHEAQRDAGASEVLRSVLRSFGVRSALEEEDDGHERLENVEELGAGVAEFDRDDLDEAPPEASDTELFLQHVALLSDIDRVEDLGGAVTLMTLHNAKGLEFPVVFVGGLEQGLFPLSRAEASREAYEEERRLFYVGVTRAMDRLILTHARRRWRAGSGRPMKPSPFLDELPSDPVVRRRVAGTTSSAPDGGPSWRGAAAEGGDAGDGDDFSWRRGAASGSGSGARTQGGRDDDVGVTYDYSESQAPLVLEEGARIVHPGFGSGTIVAVSGRGERIKAEIDFDDAGTRKVMV